MTQRNDSLDFLRGLAILLVATLHASENFKASIPPIREFADRFGALGVQVFFIVSGYTMLLTFGPIVSRQRIHAFYLRRCFRIAPLFWCAIVGYLLLQGFGPRYWAPDGVSGSDVALTVFFLHGLTPSSINNVVPGGWSIAAEMTFYAVFPLFAHLFVTRRATISPYVAICAVFVGGHLIKSLILGPYLEEHTDASSHHLIDEYFFFWLPNQIIAFGFGFALYQIVEKRTIPIVGILLLLSGSSLSHFNLSVAVLFGLALIAMKMGLKNSAMSRLGQASYSIYLVHFAVIMGLKYGSAWLGFAPVLEVMLPLTIALSLLISTRVIGPWIEQPFVNFGRRLSVSRGDERKRKDIASTTSHGCAST